MAAAPAAATVVSAGSAAEAPPPAPPADGDPYSTALSESVERIVQCVESRQAQRSGLGSSAGGVFEGGGAGGAAARSSSTGGGGDAPSEEEGGPLTAQELGELGMMCAALHEHHRHHHHHHHHRAAPPSDAPAPAAAPPPDGADGNASDASSSSSSSSGESSTSPPPLRGWATVDGDVLSALTPMLERHVTSASCVDLVGEARSLLASGGNSAAGASSSKRGKAKETNAAAAPAAAAAASVTVDQWLQPAKGNLGRVMVSSSSQPGGGFHRLSILLRGLEAASILLSIMTSRGVDQRAVSEDGVEACVSLMRQHLHRNVLPAVSGTGHIAGGAAGAAAGEDEEDADAAGATSASSDGLTPPRKRARTGAGSGRKRPKTKRQQLSRDLKKVYKPILSSVGVLAIVMERMDLLVRSVQLDDRQLLSICSASLSTLAVDPTPSPQNSVASLAHVVQVASVGLVTSVFRRYPRHRTIIVEDLFPLMLQMPTSKRSMRTYAVRCRAATSKTLALMESAGCGPGAGGAGASGGSSSSLLSPAPSRRRSSHGGGAADPALSYIQMMTALFLHLVQSCVVMPIAMAPPVGNSNSNDDGENGSGEAAATPKDSWDMPRLTSGTAAASGAVDLFVSEFAKRCSRKGEEGGASEFRPVLVNLVEDLLLVRFDAEFPAADMILMTFCRRLSSDLLSCSTIGHDKSSRVHAEPTYLATAFTVLGMICTSIGANLRCHRESPLKLPKAQAIDADAESGANPATSTSEELKCFCGRKNLVDAFMLDCDRCHGWFHGSCVGISKDNAPKHWMCDDCTLQAMVIEETKAFASRCSGRRKRSRAELTGGPNGDVPQAASPQAAPEVDDIYIMRQLLLNYLATSRLPMIKAAKEFHLARWIQEFELLRNSEDADTVLDAELKGAHFLDQWNILIPIGATGAGGGSHTHHQYLSAEGNGKLMEALTATKGELSAAFPRLLGVLLGLMGDEDTVALRKLAVKAISQVLQVDPKLMLQRSVRNEVARRFRDDAISVREASVSLVGSFVLQSPNVATAFHPLLLEKIGDDGISVRKRAVKIFRDLLISTPNYGGRASACSVMLQRAADPKEDDGVRDLIHETFQTIWFDTSTPLSGDGGILAGSSSVASTNGSRASRRRQSQAAASTEQRLVAASKQMVEVVACSGGQSDSLTKLVRELLFGLGEGNKESKAAMRKRRQEAAQGHCANIVSSLLEQLLSFEENRGNLDTEAAGQKLVALMATLGVFAESSPSLLIQHLDTILPYLKADNGVSKEDEATVAASVSRIISRCSPILSAVDAERLGESIVDDLSKIIYQMGCSAMGASIDALSKLAAHDASGTKPGAKLLTLARAFYSFLYRTKDADVAKLKASVRGNVHRALSALGSICRFHHFEEESFDHSDKDLASLPLLDPIETALEWSNISYACYVMFSLYLKMDHVMTKCQALRAMNGIFIARPRVMLAVEQTGLLTEVMSDSAHRDLKLQALRCWREILLCEEKRVDSGEAREQMDAKEYITVSKRISGDQDEDASLVGGVLAQHSTTFFRLVVGNDQLVRSGCLDVVGDLLRQGLINPIQTVPYLLALQGDVGAPEIRKKALKLLISEGEKRPDMLRQRVRAGVKATYAFQRRVYPDRLVTAVTEQERGSIEGAKIECIFSQIFKESIRSSKVQRHGLFQTLLGLFEIHEVHHEEEDKRHGAFSSLTKKKKQKMSLAKKLPELAFAAQVLAHLPYNNASDALFIIYGANARLVDGELFLERVANFLRPHGLSSEDEFDANDYEEDAIELASKLKSPSDSKDLKVMRGSDFDVTAFAELCAEASTLVLLVKLVAFLTSAYHLSYDRIRDYMPSEKDKISDRGATSSIATVFSIEDYVKEQNLDMWIARYAEWRKCFRDRLHDESTMEKKRKRSSSSSEGSSDSESMSDEEDAE